MMLVRLNVMKDTQILITMWFITQKECGLLSSFARLIVQGFLLEFATPKKI
jgi:hypothetical protein